LQPAVDHCWTHSRTRNHTETHCVFQEHPCWNPQQVTLYRANCITQKRRTATRSRPLLIPQQNRKPHRNLLCVSLRPLLKPTTSRTLYRAHCTEQNYHQAIQECSRNVNTDEGWTWLLQYKHFYTNKYKSNKKGYRRLSLDDQISEEQSQSNDSSSSSSRKQLLMKTLIDLWLQDSRAHLLSLKISNFRSVNV